MQGAGRQQRAPETRATGEGSGLAAVSPLPKRSDESDRRHTIAAQGAVEMVCGGLVAGAGMPALGQYQQRRRKALGDVQRRNKREWSALYERQQRQREQLAEDCRRVLGRVCSRRHPSGRGITAHGRAASSPEVDPATRGPRPEARESDLTAVHCALHYMFNDSSSSGGARNRRDVEPPRGVVMSSDAFPAMVAT